MLVAPTERHLLDLHRKLSRLEIEHVLIREPDLGDQATAIGVSPQPRDEMLRRIFARYKLLR